MLAKDEYIILLSRAIVKAIVMKVPLDVEPELKDNVTSSTWPVQKFMLQTIPSPQKIRPTGFSTRVWSVEKFEFIVWWSAGNVGEVYLNSVRQAWKRQSGERHLD